MQPTLFGELAIAASAQESDEWYTPKWVFDALQLTFDLDVCAPPTGPLHTPTSKWYSIQDNGLEQPWHGLIWMNPPYSNPLPWIDRFIEHNNGVALLPTSTGRWMLNLWHSESSWLPLPPMKFVNKQNQEAKGFMPIRCWLVACGKQGTHALDQSGLGKVRHR